MKIMKIFGVVVGIHVLALVLIFANPGCSSSTKPPPSPSDTVSTPPPNITVPMSTAPSTPAQPSPTVSFNPDAPAVGTTASASGAGRYTPTRPGTPVATTLVPEPVMDVTPVTTYSVKPGDSLWTIAKKNGITVAQLAGANSLGTSANLKPGQKLVIPSKPASSTAPASSLATSPAPTQAKSSEPVTKSASAASGGQVRHTVKSGETLGAIARTYGVKSADIAVANNITDPAKIRAGMELVIPGWESPGGKSGKSGKSGTTKTAVPPANQPPAAPPTINIESTQPAPSSDVPVIRIDEGPVSPAPRTP